jgi:GH24 family phage-related lysozyme (muramidase)
MKDFTLPVAYSLIKALEGEQLEAYLDSENILTIGIGITEYFYPGLTINTKITAEESQALFCRVIQAFIPRLTKLKDWNSLTANQQAAMISFAFNTGYYPGHPDFDTLNRALSISGTNPQVPKAFMLYVNPGSPSELGLKRRRRAEGLVWYGRSAENAKETAWKEIK